jgi:hypothetical protein
VGGRLRAAGATDELPWWAGGLEGGGEAAVRRSRAVSTEGILSPPTFTGTLAVESIGLNLATGMGSTLRRLRSRMRTRRSGVTLVIYGWYDSQPGTLAWVFPSLRAALHAVRALRNAMGWLIVEGKRARDGDDGEDAGEVDVDSWRRVGRVLAEHGAGPPA